MSTDVTPDSFLLVSIYLERVLKIPMGEDEIGRVRTLSKKPT